MVTVTETSKRTLEGRDEIAAYLEQCYGQMHEGAVFRIGEVVDIVARAGVPPDVGVGDVAVWILEAAGTPWSHILALTASGTPILIQIQTDNLAKREAE